MSVAIPPIPPPFGASSGNPGSPNANRVDTMPTTTDLINTTTTKDVAQSVVDENLHQLIDSRGGSHVTNVPAFNKEDFTSWKVKILVFLDGLEPYLLKTLEDGPFVPIVKKGKSEKGLIVESFDRDEESVSSKDEETTRIRAFMAISEDEPFVGKADARFGQWVDITIKKTQGTIFNQNDEVVLISPRRRDVYVIDMSSFNKESNACFFAKASLRVKWLWHKRLSYLNFKNINNLTKQNLVSRLPSLTFSKDKNCLACEKEKHHRASFKTKRSVSINNSLYLLRPVKPQTISHNKYTLVIVDEYSRSILEKRIGKTSYDVFKGRSPDISYIYVFGCPVYIHNHKDHLGKFDVEADDGFFMGDAINFNENKSFPDDEFIEPRPKNTQCSVNIEYFPYISAYENITLAILPTIQNFVTSEEPPEFTIADGPPTDHKLDYAESAKILC
nr:retrovirus-related Pol polyprotein from transposon TNT 1-94 [Tanacetum cinerariifolium]